MTAKTNNKLLKLSFLTGILLAAAPLMAASVKIGDYTWYYTTSGTTATIVAVSPTTGAIEIPREIVSGKHVALACNLHRKQNEPVGRARRARRSRLHGSLTTTDYRLPTND